MSVRIDLSWEDFKSGALKKHIAVQEEDVSNALHLYLVEGGIEWRCILFKLGVTGHDPAAFADYLAYKVELRVNEPIDPRGEEGRQLIVPSTEGSDLGYVFTSFGDGATAMFEGGHLHALVGPGEEDVDMPIKFNDRVRYFGATIQWEGGEMSADECDTYTAGVRFDNTLYIVPNTSSLGNAFNFGGAILPAPGIGTFDVDLTKALFVPAPQGAGGFWNWDNAPWGHGLLSPAPAGDGKFFILDGVLEVTIAKVFLLGNGMRKFDTGNMFPVIIYPGTELFIKAHKMASGSVPLKLVADILIGRGPPPPPGPPPGPPPDGPPPGPPP